VITAAQAEFLKRSYAAGLASQHPWPGYAAAETALESAWGTDELTVKGNNLFGQKAGGSTAGAQCIYCDTREEGAHAHWYTAKGVAWPIFPSWTDCYNARISLLSRTASRYPNYAAALHAQNGADFVTFVSRTWSTWTGRAAAALSIYNSHRDLLGGIQ
jgi:hypothetical protein